MDGASDFWLVQKADIFQEILLNLSVLDLRRAACTCQEWRNAIYSWDGFDRRLLLVTVSGTNELALVSVSSGDIIQRLPVTKNGRKKRKLSYQTRAQQASYCWPTCLAAGPNGHVFVSQYKVQGILEFRRVPEGLAYRRTLAMGPSFVSPEGIVVAHDSVYVVSVENGSVSRLTLDTGQIMEQTGGENMDDEYDFMTLWGMCISPDKRSLFIAGHENQNEEDYRQPTEENTGCILRLDLEEDGSFKKDQDGFPQGYYVQQIPTRRRGDNGTTFTQLKLNRPSNPEFCRHGVLHVSSFVSFETGRRRRIEKFTCNGFPWTKESSNEMYGHLGWLEEEVSSGTTDRIDPWGINFSKTSNEVYVTCSSSNSAGQCVVKLADCGCRDEPFKGKIPTSIPCGSATTLVGRWKFDQANFVLPLH